MTYWSILAMPVIVLNCPSPTRPSCPKGEEGATAVCAMPGAAISPRAKAPAKRNALFIVPSPAKGSPAKTEGATQGTAPSLRLVQSDRPGRNADVDRAVLRGADTRVDVE